MMPHWLITLTCWIHCQMIEHPRTWNVIYRITMWVYRHVPSIWIVDELAYTMDTHIDDYTQSLWVEYVCSKTLNEYTERLFALDTWQAAYGLPRTRFGEGHRTIITLAHVVSNMEWYEYEQATAGCELPYI